MESLKAKSKEFEKIKVEIENAISKKELEQKVQTPSKRSMMPQE